ncbi:MAG: secretin N-terminal domain-containing protein, partial [Planctomycetota bacterium]
MLAQLLDARLRESEAGAGRSAEELAQLLDVVADPATNTLIVSAPESVLAIAGEVVGALDREGAGAARTSVRVVPLAFAPAAETARALQQAAGAMDLPSGGPVSVTPAPGSNALLLTGAPKDIDAVEALIDPLDQRPSDAETLAVRTFTLEHAEASRLASTIERLLVQQRETDPRVLSLRLRFNRQAALRDPAPPIRVEADPRTNALLVSGPASSVELAASLIDQLDTPATAPADRVLTYTPARATPDELVAAVSRVLERTQTNPAERAELVAEARTGVVLAMGTEASAAEAVRLLMEFDDRTPEAPGTEIGVIELNHADANAIASAVRSAIDDRSRWPESLLRAERAGARVPAPRVTPDRDANRLLVSAPPELVRVAREMASALDRETPAQTVRVFKLSEGAAASVSQAVRSALDPAVGPGEPKLVVSAEEGANAVVVSGSAERVAEAAALIESLDASAGPDDLGARTIMLKNARAETVAPVLERVLARESIIDSLNWWERAQYVSRFGNDEDRPVRVVADARLNVLVISGPPAVLDLAEAMAGELDRAPDAAAERTVRSVRVIPMIHGEAGSVARQLTQMFAEDDSGEVPPVISADEAANALIVRATPDQFESLSRLAGELDRAALSAGREVRTIPIDRSRAEA